MMVRCCSFGRYLGPATRSSNQKNKLESVFNESDRGRRRAQAERVYERIKDELDGVEDVEEFVREAVCRGANRERDEFVVQYVLNRCAKS